MAKLTWNKRKIRSKQSIISSRVCQVRRLLIDATPSPWTRKKNSPSRVEKPAAAISRSLICISKRLIGLGRSVFWVDSWADEVCFHFSSAERSKWDLELWWNWIRSRWWYELFLFLISLIITKYHKKTRTSMRQNKNYFIDIYTTVHFIFLCFTT